MAGVNIHRWTKEEVAKLRRLYRYNNGRVVAELMGLTESVIHAACNNHNVRHAPDYRHMAHSKVALTEAETTFIKKNYHKFTNHELAERMGRSESVIQSVRRQYGIANKENLGRFKKGLRPWNFRTKGLVVSTPGMRRSQFKRGHLPCNTKHDGAITVRLDHPKDRNGRPYKWIRVAVGKWVHLHRWKWEQKHGPVPRGCVVSFKDGDTMNTNMGNLVLLSMADNLARNMNREKASQASRLLSDNYVAGRLARGDKKLRRAIIHGAPELVAAQRTLLLTKRQIRNDRQNKAKQAD